LLSVLIVSYSGGGTGRHAGLKILFAVMRVTVQFRSRVLKKLKIYFQLFVFWGHMFYTYILYSANYDRFYVGQCEDVGVRLQRHNKKGVPSTKPYVPWELVYFEEYISRARHQAVNLKSKRKKAESI
jgi:putative endonuclease